MSQKLRTEFYDEVRGRLQDISARLERLEHNTNGGFVEKVEKAIGSIFRKKLPWIILFAILILEDTASPLVGHLLKLLIGG